MTLSTVKNVGRRLAVQTLISGTVMAGLTLAVHVDLPSLPWPLGGEKYVPETPIVMPEPGLAETPGVPQEASPAAIVMASGKAERLPTPPKEPATASVAGKDVRPIEMAVASTPRDVVLFDACMPRCESQDPLTAANRSPAEATPPAAAVQLARYLDDTAQSSAVPRDDTGLIDANSSRVAAVGQAGLRAPSRAG